MVSDYTLDSDNTTWNPWVGCHKCSEGCDKCYVIGQSFGDRVRINKNQYSLPIKRKRKKKGSKTETYELEYIIKPGSVIYVCTQSDFFIEEADISFNDINEICSSFFSFFLSSILLSLSSFNIL